MPLPTPVPFAQETRLSEFISMTQGPTLVHSVGVLEAGSLFFAACPASTLVRIFVPNEGISSSCLQEQNLGFSYFIIELGIST